MMNINPKPGKGPSMPADKKGGHGLDSPCKGGHSNNGNSPRGK